MPTKTGNGGHGQEQYDPNDGRYVEDGIPNKSTFTKKNNLGNDLTPQQEKYFQNSKMRDNDGNLIIMYRGDETEFDEFDRSKMKKSGQLGNGFYFTTENTHAGQYGNTKEYYLNIENPLSVTEKNLSYENVLQLITQLPQLDEDFDLSNYGYDVDVKKLAKTIYDESNSDFAILRDLNFSCYGNMSGLVELTNQVLGTNYDGIITNIETVVFNPNQIKLVSNQNPTNSNSISDGQTQTNNTKQQQLEIIQKHNPAPNDINTWIRDVNDIKTLRETLQDDDYVDYDEYIPDWTKQMAEEAIKSGYVTVYSSYPIEQGIFVSPSRMEAQSYAGNGRVYSKKVPINSIAWIDPTQGQYANIEEAEAMKYFNGGNQ